MKTSVIQLSLALFGIYAGVAGERLVAVICVAAALVIWALRRDGV